MNAIIINFTTLYDILIERQFLNKSYLKLHYINVNNFLLLLSDEAFHIDDECRSLYYSSRL